MYIYLHNTVILIIMSKHHVYLKLKEYNHILFLNNFFYYYSFITSFDFYNFIASFNSL